MNDIDSQINKLQKKAHGFMQINDFTKAKEYSEIQIQIEVIQLDYIFKNPSFKSFIFILI